MWYNIYMETIFEYTQNQVTQYPTTTIDIGDFDTFNQYELFNTIEAYTSSKYTGGEYDKLGRRKPFYNITQRLLNKQRAAEDIDTKDIQLTTTRPDHYAKSLLMTVANKKWMKMANFSKTLNQMTEIRGKFGGVLIKKVIDKGLLKIEVVDWLNTITDPNDIDSGVKIQKLMFNPAELMNMKKSGWENVEDAIKMAKEIDGNSKNSTYITVYVVSGVLPRTYIDENANEFEYSEQLQVLTLTKEKDENGDDKQSGIILYQTEGIEKAYKYLPYNNSSSRSLGRGIVEQALEAQVSINEVVINQKNTMDIAGKPIFQQLKGSSSARNVWTSIMEGDIIEYNTTPISLIQATPNSLNYNQTVMQEWKGQVSDATSVLDANTGNMPASATFRGQALQNQNADQPFETKKEEMDIFLREVYIDWIIPFLKKWIRRQDFLEAEMPADMVEKVLNDFSYKSARKIVDKKYYDGEYNDVPAGQLFIQMALDTEIEKDIILQDMPKDKLWLKSDSNYLDGIEFDLDIIITDEQRIKQVYLSNQIDLLNSYLANRDAFTNDPNAMKMYNAIQETLGQEPLESLDQPVTQGEQEQPTAPVAVNAEQ